MGGELVKLSRGVVCNCCCALMMGFWCNKTAIDVEQATLDGRWHFIVCCCCCWTSYTRQEVAFPFAYGTEFFCSELLGLSFQSYLDLNK